MREPVHPGGFNLHYGVLKDAHDNWVNPKQLRASILKPHHNIVSVVY